MKEIIIRDPIHNFITIEKGSVFSQLIDTMEFQRLRFIRQLGLSFYTYPGATHTRFDHSLGVYHLSTRLCERFDEYIGERDKIQIRVAALLHDIGHFALSHVLEGGDFYQDNHEKWTRKILLNSETEINEVLKEHFSSNEIKNIVNRILEGPSLTAFHHDIISSQLDVDRFDYLVRDAYFTGNPAGNIDIERLLRVVTIKDNKMVIDYNKGRFVLEHYIISRYFMYNEVYKHRVTIGVEEMFKSILKRAKDLTALDSMDTNHALIPILRDENISLEEYLQFKDSDLISTISKWCKNKDAILNDLCNRLFTRDIFKSIEINMCQYEQHRNTIDHTLNYHEYNPDYYHIYCQKSEKNAYEPYDVNKEKDEQDEPILFDDGEEIIKKIPNLQSLTMKRNPTIYLPQEVKNAVKHLFIIPEAS